jgi:hypothetical protein
MADKGITSIASDRLVPRRIFNQDLRPGYYTSDLDKVLKIADLQNMQWTSGNYKYGIRLELDNNTDRCLKASSITRWEQEIVTDKTYYIYFTPYVSSSTLNVDLSNWYHQGNSEYTKTEYVYVYVYGTSNEILWEGGIPVTLHGTYISGFLGGLQDIYADMNTITFICPDTKTWSYIEIDTSSSDLGTDHIIGMSSGRKTNLPINQTSYDVQCTFELQSIFG